MPSDIPDRGFADPPSAASSVSIAEYVFACDDAHFRASSRHRKPASQRRREHAALVIWTFLLVLWLTHSIATQRWGQTIGAGSVLAVGAFLVGWVPHHGLKRFRLSASYGANVRARFTDAGLESAGPSVASTFQWSVFAKAILAEDGVLLVSADDYALWMPEAARTSGTREAVEHVVEQHVRTIERRR